MATQIRERERGSGALQDPGDGPRYEEPDPISWEWLAWQLMLQEQTQTLFQIGMKTRCVQKK